MDEGSWGCNANEFVRFHPLGTRLDDREVVRFDSKAVECSRKCSNYHSIEQQVFHNHHPVEK